VGRRCDCDLWSGSSGETLLDCDDGGGDENSTNLLEALVFEVHVHAGQLKIEK